MEVNVPVSVGELLDKLSIVEIKIKNISDSQKLEYLNKEFNLLKEKADDVKSINTQKYDEFYSSLLKTNSKLWEIEDDIRDLENLKNFDEAFVSLARSVYITNDERFEIKTKINNFFGSSIVEQKELKEY
tara:strand:+ start:1553 stop:1942 length:390 start_codon:yes stop_codon:yes gene_type:complete